MSELRRLVPSLNALLAFEAVVRCGTFARAADELCVTAPAVSRTIGRLETHLGLRLFRRTATGAVLTAEGSALHQGVSSGFAEVEKALLRVRPARPETSAVVVSVSSAFATHWFMPRMACFRERFPKADIRFHLISGPLSGPVEGVDIAMRFDHGSDARHVARPLMPELLVPIRAPNFQGMVARTGDLLPAVDRIINLSTEQPDWSSLFADAVPERRAQRLLFSDYTVVVQAALLGQGVALGWLNVVSHLLAHGSLVPVGTTLMATGRQCQLVTSRNGSMPLASDICDWMAEQFRTDAAEIDARYPGLELSTRIPN